MSKYVIEVEIETDKRISILNIPTILVDQLLDGSAKVNGFKIAESELKDTQSEMRLGAQ